MKVARQKFSPSYVANRFMLYLSQGVKAPACLRLHRKKVQIIAQHVEETNSVFIFLDVNTQHPTT